MQVWDEKVAEFSNEVIEKSIKYCEENIKWFPQLSEFIQICLREQRNSKVCYIDQPKKAKETDYSIRRIIDEGSYICKKIKQIYPDASWTRVAMMFTALKQKTRSFYPGYNEIKFLETLVKYPDEDIKEEIGN